MRRADKEAPWCCLAAIGEAYLDTVMLSGEIGPVRAPALSDAMRERLSSLKLSPLGAKLLGISE